MSPANTRKSALLYALSWYVWARWALRTGSLAMSLNLTGLADVAERSLQQIAEIADDRRQTLDGAKHHHAHVDVRLNELEP